MKNFRLHITKSFSFIFVLLGFLLHMAEPVQKNKMHSEFTSWLDAKVKTEENVELRSLINKLADDSSELNEVIRKASDIVSENSNDFELPLSEQSQDENDVFKLLLKEWKNYQNSSSGMGKAVIVKQANPHSILPLDGFSFSGKFIGQHSNLFLTSSKNSYQQSSIQLFNESASPLKSGIAINAP